MFSALNNCRSGRVPYAACFLGALAVLFLSFGCQKPRSKPVLTKDQMKRIQASIMAEQPKPNRFIGAKFGSLVELVGVDLDKDTVAPGGKVKVSWYWKSLEKTQGHWKIFVHMEVPGKRRATYDHHAVEGLYPVEDWNAGETIKDSQVFDIDPRFPAGEAIVYVGIYDEKAWKTEKKDIRLPIASAGAGKGGEQSRLEAFRITIGGTNVEEKKAPEPKAAVSQKVRYRAVRIDKPPVLDGNLSDGVWSQAAWTRYFLRPDGQPLDEKLRTRAKLLFDDQNLYVAFEILDSDIVNKKKARDEALWQEDVVEVYLDPGKDGRDYVEFQFAPTEMIFDAHFTAHRTPEWSLAAKRFNLEGLEAKVSLVGTVNKKDSGDQMWAVEAKIPFKGLPGVTAVPRVGTVWGLNLYRIDSSNPNSVQGMGTLAPVGSDFHSLKDAASLVFGPALKSNARAGSSAAQKKSDEDSKLEKLIPSAAPEAGAADPGSGGGSPESGGGAASGIKAVFSPGQK